MASVRRTGGVQIARRDVTMTPRSGLDNLLGFAESVTSFAQGLKALGERRKDERIARETNMRNTRMLTVRDQLRDAYLKSGQSLEQYAPVADKLVADELAFGEKEGWDDEVMARYAVDLSNMDAKWKDKLTEVASERQFTQRVNDMQEVSAQRLGDMEAHGRTFMQGMASGDLPKIAEGVGGLNGMYGATEDPDGAILAGSNPLVAAELQVRHQKEWDNGAMYEWLDQQSQAGNLSNALIDLQTGGVVLPPDKDGNVRRLGALHSDEELRQVARNWTQAHNAGDRARDRAESNAVAEDSEHDAALEDQWYRAYLQGGVVPTAEQMGQLRDPAKKRWWILNAGRMNETETPAQQAAWWGFEEGLKTELRAIDPGDQRAGLARTEALRGSLAQVVDTLHPRRLAEARELIGAREAEIEQYSGLPDDEQRIVDREAEWEAFKRRRGLLRVGTGANAEQQDVTAGVSALTEQALDDWFHLAIRDPELQDSAFALASHAVRLVQHDANIPIGAVMGQLFGTARKRQALVDDPRGALALLQGQLGFGGFLYPALRMGDDGQLSMARTAMAMAAAGVPEGSQQWAGTLAVLRFAHDAGAAVDLEPAARERLAAERAKALEATAKARGEEMAHKWGDQVP